MLESLKVDREVEVEVRVVAEVDEDWPPVGLDSLVCVVDVTGSEVTVDDDVRELDAVEVVLPFGASPDGPLLVRDVTVATVAEVSVALAVVVLTVAGGFAGGVCPDPPPAAAVGLGAGAVGVGAAATVGGATVVGVEATVVGVEDTGSPGSAVGGA